ncbi:hypothetical protein BDV41DRAFT_568781 [Aspergillus transmontanensis]|uniref:Cobalamin-independent methionine synthase MetE C-terminal/archaeal domain-containing protein n=1 Tax=Aspergillus transmontanensis TaxID=1034304 RepID=A0A5N6VH36_9EURO|nr:hypothetical protein BDV41DRAFT_568781 [Aspergillus transmontanensis]
MAAPIGVHLVGSIPLSDTEQVFRQIPAALPSRLYSIPDGEPGVRQNYIATRRPPRLTHESVALFQYDGAALDSYKRIVELRDQGIIPPGLEPFYERRILDSLNVILTGIPAHDLAVQRDLPFEVIDLEYERDRLPNDFPFMPHFAPVKQGVLDRIQHLCAGIPGEVDIGFHLCYGDLEGKHLIEPEDLGLLVEFANSIVKAIRPRAVNWIHMPVPKDRDDVAYFEPLKGLAVDEDTRLVLGLVHFDDEEGTKRRIKAAQRATRKRFGVATECGMGRVSQEQLDSILRISKGVTEPIN